jgi:hypothetical protein
VRTWHKVLLVTAVLGLPTVVLGQMIWPSPSDGPEPTSGQLGLFVGLSLFDALAWGPGIAWLLFALPRLRRVAGGSEPRTWAMYLSVGWALVSWWPHSNMHRSNGDDLWGLLLIDYLFHPTLMVSVLVLGWSLLTLPPAGASGSPVSLAGKPR